jgi:hypothetical protein
MDNLKKILPENLIYTAPFLVVFTTNCNLIYIKIVTLQYKACIEAEKTENYINFKEFQELLIIQLKFVQISHMHYREKSTAYLKKWRFF